MYALRLFTRNFTILWFLLILNALHSRTCHQSSFNADREHRTAQSDYETSDSDSVLLSDDPSKSGESVRKEVSEEELRLEYIKHQILQKLGMSRAPKVKRNAIDTSVYQPILEQQSTAHLFPASESPISEESDKLFVFPSTATSTSSTFNLTLRSKASKYPIKQISLFIKHRQAHNQFNDITVISLSALSKGNVSLERVMSVLRPLPDREATHNENLLHTSFKWSEYNLTQILLDFNMSSSNQQILISSQSLKIFSSFISIEYDYVISQRNKRSINCSPNGNTTSCCRESFYVNFTHIHWDNWILQPTGYYANYCKGKCDISQARYHHTTVVHKYQSIISLCCSPREMSSIPLIYIDENGYVLKKFLTNMVVESCDCA
ncbi:myostatin-like protein [Dinothrombium tinctorium]|uniref:Myostatin-like protein n=1 Tax=Dinothrombium tinctorium TaxID=1965070 RepID=A0A3S3QC05_9ACAR|nr:myostatin-like protein [Dinothrombium tinctorium]RWS17461.1 myostatin-like protein [Dinothrombium tinctorium]